MLDSSSVKENRELEMLPPNMPPPIVCCALVVLYRLMGSLLRFVSMSPALALNLRIKGFCWLSTSPCAHAHIPPKNAAPSCLHVFTTIKVAKRVQGKHQRTLHTSRYVVMATYFPLRVAVCVCARGWTSSSTDTRVTSTAPLIYLRHLQIH